MKNIIKLLLIALIFSLLPNSNVSFAYLMDNNKYYHIEAPDSQLRESIVNIKTYLANNNRITPKFYSKPDDVKSVISFPFSLKPFEIKYIYTNKYQYLYNKAFSIIGDNSSIEVKVGAEYTIDNNSFVTLEDSYQKGDSFNFKYSLELISKNKMHYNNQ